MDDCERMLSVERLTTFDYGFLLLRSSHAWSDPEGMEPWMVDQLGERIALATRQYPAVCHVSVRRNDQSAAIRHLLQNVLEWLPDGTVVAPWGDPACTNGRVHIGGSGAGLEDDEDVKPFSCIGLETRQCNDATRCRVLDESTRRVDGPVIGDCDELDAKLLALVE